MYIEVSTENTLYPSFKMFEDFNIKTISLSKYLNTFFKILWLIFACATMYMLATIYIGWQKFSSSLAKFDTTTDIAGIDIGKYLIAK